MKPSDLRNLIIVGALLCPALGYGAFRFEHHREWLAAQAEALDALNRAYEYRDAGTLLYEPRRKDFDVADDRLQRASQFSSTAQADAGTVHECGDELRIYRELADTAEESSSMANRAMTPEIRKESLANAQGSVEQEKSIAKDIEHCLAAR